jgi:hypothetical protein
VVGLVIVAASKSAGPPAAITVCHALVID